MKYLLDTNVLSDVDGQIAAIARVNGLIIVTRNINDFKPFTQLTVENWHIH